MNLNDELLKFDELIRAGQRGAVQAELSRIVINLSKVERVALAPLAETALRINEPMLVLKILSRIVRPAKAHDEPATAAEVLVYAAAFVFLGALEEARELLERVDGEMHPDAWLYLAFADFGEWNYQAAVPKLKKFIRSGRITAYRRLIGQVNLAAALINSVRLDEARELLQRLVAETHAGGHRLLEGSCHELLAQASIFRRDFASAFAALERAGNALQNQRGTFLLFVKKWGAIAELRRMNGGSAAVAALEPIREEARKLRHWETLRDCDLFQACATHDERLLSKVLFGTPYKHYRRRVELFWSGELPHLHQFDWEPSGFLGGASGESAAPLVLSGSGLGVSSALLRTLCLDFYKPARLGFLFSRTFPGEYFNPFNGPHRLDQTLYRLRRQLEEKSLPLKIIVEDGEWVLSAEAPCVIRLDAVATAPAAQENVAEHEALNRLRLEFGGKPFRAERAASLLELTPRQVREILKVGQETLILSKRGSGRGADYVFTRRKKPVRRAA